MHYTLRSQVSYTGGALHTQVTGQLHWGCITHSGHRLTHQGKLGSVYQGKPYTLGLTDRPGAILQGCLLTWRHFTGLLAYLAVFYRAAWFYLVVFYRATCLPGTILQGCLLTWQYFTGLLAYLVVFSRAASLPGGIFQGCLLTWQYFTGPLAYLAVFCTLWRDAIRSAGYSWGSERTQRFH